MYRHKCKCVKLSTRICIYESSLEADLLMRSEGIFSILHCAVIGYSAEVMSNLRLMSLGDGGPVELLLDEQELMVHLHGDRLALHPPHQVRQPLPDVPAHL